MLPMNNRSTAVEDVPQKTIIENRRKLREKMLKQIGQRTAIAEKNLHTLHMLTK